MRLVCSCTLSCFSRGGRVVWKVVSVPQHVKRPVFFWRENTFVVGREGGVLADVWGERGASTSNYLHAALPVADLWKVSMFEAAPKSFCQRASVWSALQKRFTPHRNIIRCYCHVKGLKVFKVPLWVKKNFPFPMSPWWSHFKAVNESVMSLNERFFLFGRNKVN